MKPKYEYIAKFREIVHTTIFVFTHKRLQKNSLTLKTLKTLKTSKTTKNFVPTYSGTEIDPRPNARCSRNPVGAPEGI